MAGEWRSDPAGRHQYRWWDGTTWTGHVSDNGETSVDPPSASATVPDPAPAVAEDPTRSGVPAGQLVGWIGIIAAAVAVFLQWGSEDFFDKSRTGVAVPFQFLWDTTPASFDSFAVGWPVLAAVAATAGGFATRRRGLAVVGSAAVCVLALLYVNGVRAVRADDLYDIEGSILDNTGAGPWLCLAGGVAALVGSRAIPDRSPST